MAAQRLPNVLLATLGCATLALGLGGAPLAARAGDTPPTPNAPSIRVPAVEILDSLDLPDDERSWLSTHLTRMRVHKKYGLSYTHRLDVGDKGIVLKFRGPVLGKVLKKRRRIGLSFEIEF